MHGFQDRVQTPDADGVQEQALPVEKENVPKMRPDPERVQELREMRSWRPVAAVVQPVLSQSIEAVEKDIKSLTIAQLKPFLRAEGLAVSGTKAQMQERFMECKLFYFFPVSSRRFDGVFWGFGSSIRESDMSL